MSSLKFNSNMFVTAWVSKTSRRNTLRKMVTVLSMGLLVSTGMLTNLGVMMQPMSGASLIIHGAT